MENFKIIQKLESTSSRLSKEEIILNEMKNKNEVFFKGMSLAYNKLLTFGVKQVPKSESNGDGLEWEEFSQLADKLISRKLTGHAARDEILEKMEKSHIDEWNFFYKRILQKDMRCGLSEKTINNVAKKNGFVEFIIPVFACQLAQDSELHQKKLTGEKILEVKLDGVRVITVLYPNGKVDMFSRNGKELTNFNNLQEELREKIRINTLDEAIVIDGEVVSKNFQELMKQIHRKEVIQNQDATLFLFDFLPFEKFKDGVYKKTYKLRTLHLKNWYDRFIKNSDKIKLIEKKIINLDCSEGLSVFRNFNNESIVQGYEGIMIKDPESFYECKRSTTWLKLKPVIEISLEVKDFEEGTGRNAGKLGAIIAEGVDNDKFFRLNIGSGFSDEQRESFWKDKHKLIGQIVEIKADSISKSQDGEHWSLRFPRFKCFRGFDIKEKL